MCRSERWGVGGNLGDQALYFCPKWLDEGAFPPYVYEGAFGWVASPAGRRNGCVEFMNLIRRSVPSRKYFISILLDTDVNGAFVSMTQYSFPLCYGEIYRQLRLTASNDHVIFNFVIWEQEGIDNRDQVTLGFFTITKQFKMCIVCVSVRQVWSLWENAGVVGMCKRECYIPEI